MSKHKNTSGSSSDESDDVKEKFRELPLNQKLSTLMQLEATTMSEAMNTLLDKSKSVSEEVMDKLGDLSRSKRGKK